MKNRNTNIRGITSLSSPWLGACSIAVCLLTVGQASAQLTWTGATSTAWNESGNWVDTATLAIPSIPADGGALNFGGPTYPSPVNQPTNNDIVGLTTGDINFLNNGVAPQSGGFTLGTLGTLGQSITLGGNITTSISGGAANQAFTDTINLNLALDASRTITTNSANGSRSHNINIIGVVSEESPDLGLTKSGGGTLGLANVANSFSGDMTITAGTVNVISL